MKRRFRLPWWPAEPEHDDSLDRLARHHLGAGSGFAGGILLGLVAAAIVLYVWAQNNCQDVTDLAQIVSAFGGHALSGHVLACRTP